MSKGHNAQFVLPRPLDDMQLRRHRRGVFDDPNIDVYIDAMRTFAVLSPTPVFDYTSYKPRSQRLNLQAYKKTLSIIERRFNKIADLLPRNGYLLEVGAAEGGFLSHVAEHRPELRLGAVEPDMDTLKAREKLGLNGDYRSIDEAYQNGVRADVVCLFHVFEHVMQPAKFIRDLLSILTPTGKVVIEVPSLSDPLLSVFKCEAYEEFYFQRQHPYVYSAASLERVLSANGLRVLELRPYQRYGLENHLNWLANRRPGGNAEFAAVFSPFEDAYLARFEELGLTDTVFAIAEAR